MNMEESYGNQPKSALDHQVIIYPKDPNSDSDSDERQEEKNNSLLADFAISSPLSREKPLWELHLISDLNCAVS